MLSGLFSYSSMAQIVLFVLHHSNFVLIKERHTFCHLTVLDSTCYCHL